MIEKETVAPSERKLVAAVIYNRLHQKMPLGIDATLRYGLNIPGTESLTKAAIASNNPYNSRRFTGLPPTPVANPASPRSRRPRIRPPSTTSTTSASRDEAALLHRERERVPAQGVRVRVRLQLRGGPASGGVSPVGDTPAMSLSRLIEIRGTTTLVGLLGWPTSHSLSPPMQNAGVRGAGLDWAYVPLPTPPDQLPTQ